MHGEKFGQIAVTRIRFIALVDEREDSRRTAAGQARNAYFVMSPRIGSGVATLPRAR